MKLIPTILCGGAGSRLWPVSREQHPKPFITLTDGQSLLQKAYLRGLTQSNVVEVVTVTNREFAHITEDALASAAIPDTHALTPKTIMVEPVGRNTAPALAMSALHTQATHGDDAILLVLPADHLIDKKEAFRHAVERAVQLAQSGKIVTFGIRPDRPETGFGYIEADGERVLRFVEKPSLETARKYLAAGNYLWNAGMFCFSAKTILTEMDKHCPDIVAGARASFSNLQRATDRGVKRLTIAPEKFGALRDISIDYAIMEKSSCVAVVACDIGWSDIGSWVALGELTEADDIGNRVEGEVVLHDVENCNITASSRVIGAVGVRDLIVIDTPDALLIADKSKAQDVRHIYSALKGSGHQAHLAHATVSRPWGKYTVLEDNPGFKIKRIEVNPGARLSLQSHRHRNEHWVVISGNATVQNGNEVFKLSSNESTYIPARHMHRISNDTTKPLIIVEVQTGRYLGEDDIIRFDDDYGRKRDHELLIMKTPGKKSQENAA
ncbi:MAG: mannose-1-phosphate guanylyltransferase/mannose-6-phosphate isomerase [Bdellovibrionales bacterium]